MRKRSDQSTIRVVNDFFLHGHSDFTIIIPEGVSVRHIGPVIWGCVGKIKKLFFGHDFLACFAVRGAQAAVAGSGIRNYGLVFGSCGIT